MPDLIDRLKDSIAQYGEEVKQRALNPAETLNTALKNLMAAPPEEIASQFMGGGVGHLSSAAMYKMFPELQKTVLKEGENLIPLYHGTSKDVDFKHLKDSPRGIWVTKDPKSASQYAVENDSMNLKYNPDSRKYESVNSASRVMPVYADVRNPYQLTEADTKWVMTQSNYAKAQKELMAKAVSAGHDAIDYGGGVFAIASSKQIKSSLTGKGK